MARCQGPRARSAGTVARCGPRARNAPPRALQQHSVRKQHDLRNPLISLRVFLPEATSSTSFHSFSDSFPGIPVHDGTCVKSIQWRLRSYSAVLDELDAGMAVPSGFPCQW